MIMILFLITFLYLLMMSIAMFIS